MLGLIFSFACAQGQPILDLKAGATCKDGYSPITSRWEDCRDAAKSLGFTGDPVNHVAYNYPWGNQRPRGCFRSTGNNRFHFNRGSGGGSQGNDRILCKLDHAPVYNLKPGATCAWGYSPLTSSWQECRDAAKQLGNSGDSVNHVAYNYPWGNQRPRGCFRSTGNNRFHFNRGSGGGSQGSDKILCKLNWAPAKTHRGAMGCPTGYRKITSSQECRKTCKQLGWATDVHGDRHRQWMYQDGCIENGLYCYFNRNRAPSYWWFAKHQRSMVCMKQSGAAGRRLETLRRLGGSAVEEIGFEIPAEFEDKVLDGDEQDFDDEDFDFEFPAEDLSVPSEDDLQASYMEDTPSAEEHDDPTQG